MRSIARHYVITGGYMGEKRKSIAGIDFSAIQP
jgi:hypothetical protein